MYIRAAGADVRQRVFSWRQPIYYMGKLPWLSTNRTQFRKSPPWLRYSVSTFRILLILFRRAIYALLG